MNIQKSVPIEHSEYRSAVDKLGNKCKYFFHTIEGKIWDDDLEVKTVMFFKRDSVDPVNGTFTEQSIINRNIKDFIKDETKKINELKYLANFKQ